MIISLAETLNRGKIMNYARGGFDSGGFDGGVPGVGIPEFRILPQIWIIS